MSQHRCLFCYQKLDAGQTDFHPKCSKRFFGTETAPVLDYSGAEMRELAQQVVARSIAVTGVQPKLSLQLQKDRSGGNDFRLTIVGLWGSFILKPPSPDYRNLPENEDLTMHLAAHFGIETAEHSLIRFSTGELAYITRRFDRTKKGKLALEDFCQISETLTADKYRGSMEKIGKLLRQLSSRPGLDAITLFELTLFCFLTGNADMHLKNFSILTQQNKKTRLLEPVLSPAYDLLNTKIALPADQEEMALTINARKRKLTRNDFDLLGSNYGIAEKALENTYRRFERRKPGVKEWISTSFLPVELQQAYFALFEERWSRIFG